MNEHHHEFRHRIIENQERFQRNFDYNKSTDKNASLCVVIIEKEETFVEETIRLLINQV